MEQSYIIRKAAEGINAMKEKVLRHVLTELLGREATLEDAKRLAILHMPDSAYTGIEHLTFDGNWIGDIHLTCDGSKYNLTFKPIP